MLSVEKALEATSESQNLDFKESFDPDSARDWCEIVKDIVAIANSGGGIIIFGADDQGTPTNADIRKVLEIDSASWVDKLAKYTNIHFSGFKITRQTKAGKIVVVMQIDSCLTPMVFEKPGTYDTGDGKQGRAFSEGSVYFRHGAKSEPGNNQDFQQAIQSNIDNTRNEILERVSRVVEAPLDHIITIKPPDSALEDSPSMAFRLVDDPSAPPIYSADKDVTHPFRMKDVIELINSRLPDNIKVNQFDIRAIRSVHQVDSNIGFFHNPKYSSPQYSEAFVEWVVKCFRDTPDFFVMARKEYQKKKR